MVFITVVFVGMYAARKLGWELSRPLYKVNCWAASILLLVWGFAIALGLRLLLDAFHPILILKIIAFGAASYVSIPNYGLIARGTIPDRAWARHLVISSCPLLVFIAASILLSHTVELPRAIGIHQSAPMTLTVEDLGRLTKQKYPGSYDDLSDADLGRLVKRKYPGAYGEVVDVLQSQPASSTAIPDRDAIQPQPSRLSRLSDHQIARVRIIQRALAEVDNSSLEKWTEDFEKDHDPEREINIWESIVDAYQRYCSARSLSNDAKREVLKVLLARSWTNDEEEVLRGTKLSILTRDEAIAVMRSFMGPVAPLEVEKR